MDSERRTRLRYLASWTGILIALIITFLDFFIFDNFAMSQFLLARIYFIFTIVHGFGVALSAASLVNIRAATGRTGLLVRAFLAIPTNLYMGFMAYIAADMFMRPD